MIIKLIGIGAVTLAVIVTAEAQVAHRQHRRPETGAVLVAGLIGMAFFVAVLLAWDVV